jgi:hypothetical protein
MCAMIEKLRMCSSGVDIACAPSRRERQAQREVNGWGVIPPRNGEVDREARRRGRAQRAPIVKVFAPHQPTPPSACGCHLPVTGRNFKGRGADSAPKLRPDTVAKPYCDIAQTPFKKWRKPQEVDTESLCSRSLHQGKNIAQPMRNGEAYRGAGEGWEN